ncbi:unnamed protein product [Prunus armeniaca]|uniref:Uncharacterized protein n=1 Tax=Prunus armeniaca TaxID=36596 RepID=A0A6J5WBI2_PRUAR|nr:unnamed protein product [Prunus armeniaca]
MISKHSKDFEAKPGPMEVSSKDSKDLETELMPTEVSSKLNDSKERRETSISKNVLEEVET